MTQERCTKCGDFVVIVRDGTVCSCPRRPVRVLWRKTRGAPAVRVERVHA